MPIVNGVGHSDSTILKIEILSKIFDMHFMITQAVIKKNPAFRQKYRYLDITAGKGYGSDSDTVSKVDKIHALEWSEKSLVYKNKLFGSPLVFLTIAESGKVHIPYRGDFIEVNKENFQELEETIKDHTQINNWQDMKNKVFLYNNNYDQAVPKLFTNYDEKELGLVFIDHSGDKPNIETLRFMNQMRPKMELLLYLSATNIKREFGSKNKYLSDYMDEIGKEYWLIKKPINKDKFQWTFLLGSNSDIFKKYKRIDFLRLDSAEAQGFFPKLDLSSKQRQERLQLKLPYIEE